MRTMDRSSRSLSFPRTFGRDNGPVFPVVIFPENIRKIIDTTHEESCFPVNYIAAALFFAASVAVGN